MATEIKPTLCRFCLVSCPLQVTLEDGVPVNVIGDKNDPTYFGYSCVKGRALIEQHQHPRRLLRPQKRLPDGGYTPIDSGQAMGEVAGRLRAIVDQHGPQSVAMYMGTMAGPYPTSSQSAMALMASLGSPMLFTAMTLDQPGKPIAAALHGRWLAGPYHFDETDSYLLVGMNPTISVSGHIPHGNPSHRLHEAKKRGLKLIVIDPRRTEAARDAEIFIQPKPGEDAAILAAMLNVIISEQLYDKAFVASDVQGFDTLRQTVASFTPEYAARRADTSADLIIEAARVFAGARRASAQAGVGPNMSGKGNLVEYLLLCLNTVCGNWYRAGDVIPNPGVTLPATQPKAQAQAPKAQISGFMPMRTRGLSMSVAGLPTSVAADEILTEGEGQIKALICVGSNPVSAWPDQLKTERAMKKLELLVTTDIHMSATAKMAHYVFAPKLSLETPATSQAAEAMEEVWPTWGTQEPYGNYTPAVVDVPEDSDLIEDWELYYGLAQRLGLQLEFAPFPAPLNANRPVREAVKPDMEKKPTSNEMLALAMHGSRIPFEQLKANGPKLYSEEVRVQAKDPDCDERLDVGNAEIMGDLETVFESSVESNKNPNRFHLIGRRAKNTYNSSGIYIEKLNPKFSHNPAYMHPDDLAALELAPGDIIEIESSTASIRGIVEPDTNLRRGLLCMTHGWGDTPGYDDQFRTIGSSTSRLVDGEVNFDRHSGIPIMGNIPVNVRPIT